MTDRQVVAYNEDADWLESLPDSDDEFLFTRNAKMNGKSLYLDAGGGSYIRAPTNNQVDIGVGGSDVISITAATLALGGMNVTTTGTVDGRDVSVDGAVLDTLQVGSSTDNALPKFDGTSGALQASGIIVTDTDNVSGIGNITLTGTVDGRDVASDGSKLDNIEDNADVTDFTNVNAALAAATATIDLDEAVTINESGADKDFRVEASGETNALFVQGSDGKVGIGTNTFSGINTKTAIVDAASGITPHAASRMLLDNVGDTGLTIGSGISNAGTLFFGDSGNGSTGRLVYDHADDSISLWTLNNERLTVDNLGKAGIGTDNPAEKLHLLDPSVDSVVRIRMQNDAEVWNCGVNGALGDVFQISANSSGENEITVSAATNKTSLITYGGKERSADPGDPAEGEHTIWQSDGTASGDDGDLMVKITAGGVTKTATLVDFSAV